MPRYNIKNLEKLLRNCDPELYSEPLRGVFRTAAKLALAEAQKRAPKSLTGKLRGSLQEGGAGNILDIDPASPPKWAKVGTDINNRGFRYPWALEASGKYHFKGRKGSTHGWFSKGFKAGLRDIGKVIKQFRQEVEGKWRS